MISIPTPKGFNFKRTALSHGWYSLPPFEMDESSWTLTRVIDLNGARPVTVRITALKASLSVVACRTLSKRAIATVTRDVRHMLRLDDDLSSFHALMAGEPGFGWITTSAAGRLLRAPTVFEDLVKTICTTNCSWSLTTKMIHSLVTALGSQSSDERRAFPSPESMASMSESFYRDEVRCGYRAPYLKELADRVASGSLDVEAWLKSDLSTPDLQREIVKVKGVGPYAAENLLRLVGRYDGLALDSWVRAEFARLRNGGRKASDRRIARFYSRFGKWSGLAFWCDMTRDWMESEEKDGKW